jgi:hypothetical protein
MNKTSEQKIKEIKEQRLAMLKWQVAMLGDSAPIDLIIEIEDIENELSAVNLTK